MRREWPRLAGPTAPKSNDPETPRAVVSLIPTPDASPGLPAPDPDRRQREVAPRPTGRRVARLASRAGVGGRGDSEFHPGTLRIDDSPRSPIGRQVFLVVVALLACAFTWSYFSWIASYTSAAGKIQMAGRTKVVEALATGKVAKILARDGDAVKAGGVLVEFDPTDALAARTILDLKLTNLRAETLRLKAEIVSARADAIDPNAPIAWDKGLPDAVRTREAAVAQADLAKLAAQIQTLTSQKHAKEAERDKYAANILAQKALVAVTQENLTMIESLLNNGYNSQAKFLDMKALLEDQQVKQTAYEGSLGKAEQAILVIASEIAKTRETFVTGATQTVSTNEQAIVDLVQQLVKADETLGDMTVAAPVSGIVHASAVTTIGQVAKARQQLMQIVPSDAPLEIQAYVSNTDIGFIRKGDPATIKITSFDYKAYGSIDGTVTDIASDSLALLGKATLNSSALDGEYRSTTDAQKTGNLQFPITVRASRSTMTVQGEEIPLVPGMGVNVEILTENRRAIDYIISPIVDLFSTAAHERS